MACCLTGWREKLIPTYSFETLTSSQEKIVFIIKMESSGRQLSAFVGVLHRLVALPIAGLVRGGCHVADVAERRARSLF